MQWTSRLLPASCVADALRAASAGDMGITLWANIAAVAASTGVTAYWAARRVE